MKNIYEDDGHDYLKTFSVQPSNYRDAAEPYARSMSMYMSQCVIVSGCITVDTIQLCESTERWI